MNTPDHGDFFSTHRALLFSIAYEILGSVVDAEDAVHDGYLRWHTVDLGTLDNPRAYLAQIVTRQALAKLRADSRRREYYVGPWLPEPLATRNGPSAPEGVDHVLTGEAVTTAMLLVLESLSPTQRAVFVLREVFDFPFAEIATAVGKTEEAARQIHHRARVRVRSGRRSVIASPAEARPIAERFSVAVASGDVQALMDVLAPHVVFLADGGGRVVGTVQRPVYGPDNVARLLIGLLAKGHGMGAMELRIGSYNGMHSVVVLIDGRLDQVTSIEVSDQVVTAVYCVRNPQKLAAVRP